MILRQHLFLLFFPVFLESANNITVPSGWSTSGESELIRSCVHVEKVHSRLRLLGLLSANKVRSLQDRC